MKITNHNVSLNINSDSSGSTYFQTRSNRSPDPKPESKCWCDDNDDIFQIWTFRHLTFEGNLAFVWLYANSRVNLE